VLETIRDVLETLAGPVPLAVGLSAVLHALCQGLQAERVALLTNDGAVDDVDNWLVVDSAGREVGVPPALTEVASILPMEDRRDGKATSIVPQSGDACMAVGFSAPRGGGMLLAQWSAPTTPVDGIALMEDAANSLRLARERQESERAREEASALRRSRALQRGFLSRLSHELRTPLTAIGGYASSLMAPDVTWDDPSEQRFLSRIAAESARLNRLVDDLLDFSAIESSTMRMLPDWCELPPVLDAAVACVTPSGPVVIAVDCQPDLPVIWADHDRLEQVFVNLLENALRHNPVGTRVWVNAMGDEESGVVITVNDDGGGLPDEVAGALFEPRPRADTPSAGAGLGLSIAKGIVDAHQGQIALERLQHGTRFSVHLPIGGPDSSHRYAEDRDLSDV
jgi:signal transduction histidine kinase